MNADGYIAKVCASLQRLGLSGDVQDTGQSVHVKLSGGKEFTTSHKFLRLVNKKQLDFRVKYGAGLIGEDRRDEKLP